MTQTLGTAPPTTTNPRVDRAADARPEVRELVTSLLDVAHRGLERTFDPDADRHVFTLRRDSGPAGISDRYTSIVLLGAGLLPEDDQRRLLHGRTATQLCTAMVAACEGVSNLGDAALLAWAAAELRHADAPRAIERVRQLGGFSGRDCYTVEAAWALCAGVAGREFTTPIERSAALDRLMRSQGSEGLFPHTTGRRRSVRAHVGCFADQVYPIQALARAATTLGTDEALNAANRCARRICDLQGDAGQWWWHYDARTGDVLEGYPVYSVHQDAMAPMALFDLVESGGESFLDPIRRGLLWLVDPPETREPLIDPRRAVIWRKVGRGDPAKLVRRAKAVSSRLGVPRAASALDRLFPPGPIDYECRPYHLGWILYAWLRRKST